MPGDQFHRLEDGLSQFFGVEQQQCVLTVVALTGERQPFAVVADIRVEHTHTEWEGVDHFRILQVAVQTYDRLGTAVGEQTVEAVVGVVIHDIVDALELLFLHHLLLLDVIDLQATHLRVVRRINEALPFQVECHEGRIIKLDAVHDMQFLLLTRLQVDLRDVGETAWGVSDGVGLVGGRIIDQRRHRTQRLRGQRLGLRDGILADGSQILLLMLLLIHLPVVPHLPERLSIDLLELFGEERVTVGGTVIELDHLLVAVGLGEVVHETGTIEIGVGTHLEVHRRTFRLQTHHGVELVAPVDDTAEVHLVITA